MREPRARRLSQTRLPSTPLPIERIDRDYAGQWVLVEITAVDELHTPIEGQVIALGKRQVHKLIDQLTASAETSQTRYCLFQAGFLTDSDSPSLADLSA